MIIPQDKLPGVKLAAWLIFDPLTGTIFKQSGHIASVVAAGSGQSNITFNAGTFEDTKYMFSALNCQAGALLYLNVNTVTTCNFMNIWNGATIVYNAGKKLAIYFYA